MVVTFSYCSHSIRVVFLTALHSIPSSDSASEAPLYLESEHEATDPKMSLHSAAQHNTQTQGDPAKLFLLVSSEVPRTTHVAVLQCLTAIVINSLQPCIPAQNFVHFLSAQSVPSSRFLAQTLRGGIPALLSRCTSLPIIACSSVALSKCLQMMGQHRPTRVHTGRDAGSVFVWVMSKNPWHTSPCPQRRRLVPQLHSDRFLCHQVGCIIHHPHVTQSVLQQHVRKVHLASGNLVGTGVILGVMLSLDATQCESVVSIACCL